jgi:hypothetical protein
MVFCNQCGRENSDDANFCTKCGRAIQGQVPASGSGPGLPVTIHYKAIAYWQNQGLFRKMQPVYEDAVLTILNNGLTSKTSKMTKQLLFRDITGVSAQQNSVTDGIPMVIVQSHLFNSSMSIPCPTINDAQELADLIDGTMRRYTS